MFKTPKGYKFAQYSDTMSRQEYLLETGNMLKISISPNDGFNKVNFTIENNQNFGRDYFEVIVDVENNIKLPLIGKLNVKGKTIPKLETEIEKLYENYYVKPFVTITISNRRAIVFWGSGSLGKAYPLLDKNTTLYEMIAQAGGIREEGKAYKIKLIRMTPGGSPQVFQFDLSKIEDIPKGNTIIMSNDIVYVESRYKLAQRINSEITPYLSLLTSALLLVALFKK
jgi:polysaccharide export outer membrane protein